ncbi:helix-turn-helix transcriptional regulator [Streptomyces sp. NBC_00401]|uniref:helix-turn-helix transcriptional regulator n=1 Tax=Streptomyces sp. NBC_00401 TaxID=2975738 RepID=UPI00225819B5|nr:helix-turn-helix transcriptional regulator [Streptomyces sp. NBC_00401]MCX5081590.1 helix-turn-helix transcriptional regulator [Streptomyces sp. NBC_00401]
MTTMARTTKTTAAQAQAPTQAQMQGLAQVSAKGQGQAGGAPGGSPKRESEIRRHELADFLRNRRARITPEQVGLPRGRRRRTPGLRREEIAQLSAVGVTWYTWLEQARDIQVSVQVLDALARTLLLDASERAHLFQLAGAVDPSPAASCQTVTPALRLMLEKLEPLPACIQNSRYDILAYNRTYGRLLCDLDTVAPEDRNCMVLICTNEQWRKSFVFLEDTIRLMAAKFRGSMAGHLGEPAWELLLKRLEDESPEFREAWQLHEVVGTRSKTKYFRNAHVGPLSLVHTDLWLGPDQGARLVTYTPADEESREGLDRLQELAPAVTS